MLRMTERYHIAGHHWELEFTRGRRSARDRIVKVPKVRFDEQIAARYDETSVHMYRSEVLDPAVDFLKELAGDGAALEFGVGTGRVALPLSGRGVHGIDISEPMLEELRRKPKTPCRRTQAPEERAQRAEGERSGVARASLGPGPQGASSASAPP